MERAQRKLEHIKYALELGDGPASTHFEDIRFLHNCLPETNPADIDLSMEIFGKRLSLPFLIDAITGGTDAVTDINAKLAQAAQRLNIAMAVGSQYGAVRDNTGLASYEVVRKYNPDGVVFANMSALATPKQAQAAIDMLAADALEIHLNAAQEQFMREGDKAYAGLLDNMQRIREHVSVPVIVKETGCGMGGAEYERLQEAGFTCFNCAGAGGTNIPAIEAARAGINLPQDFAQWGIPTAWSLLEASDYCTDEDLVIASGGIRNASQVAKAFALGADMVGIAGAVLKILHNGGVEAVVEYFTKLGAELENYLLLLGCKEVGDMRNVQIFIGGETRHYAACVANDLAFLCERRRRYR